MTEELLKIPEVEGIIIDPKTGNEIPINAGDKVFLRPDGGIRVEPQEIER